MHSHTTASLYLAASLALGVTAAHLFRPDGGFCLALLACSITLLWVAKRSELRKVFWGLAGLASLSLGMWNMAGALPENRPTHYAHAKRIPEGPARVRVLEELRHNAFKFRYLAEVTGLGEQPSEGKVLLEIRRDSTPVPLHPGQEILSPLAPTRLLPPGNPGEFDYRAYLENQGVHGRIVLDGSAFRLLKDEAPGFWHAVGKFRMRLLQNLEEAGLDPSELGVAKALLLGDRTQVDPGLYSSYKKAGVVHLLAVSGLHVGILAGFLYALLAPLGRLRHGKLLRMLPGVALLWGYALLCGFSPSVVRAVILFSFVSYALYRERPGETLHLLALAWIFMLGLINPHWLLQVGFQLSFAAVGAIVVFYPAGFRRWPWKGGLGAKVGGLLSVSLAAQAGTLPLTLFYFHQFPGVFLLSNLLLLPGIGLLLAVGFASLLLQTLSLLPPAVAAVFNLLLSGMNRLVQWSGGLEGMHLDGIPWDGVHLLLSGSALFFLGAYFRTRDRKFLRGAALLALGFQAWAIFIRTDQQAALQWVVPHKVKTSGFWVRQGGTLQVFSADSAGMAPLVRDASTVWQVDSTAYRPLSGHYKLGPYRLRVLDSFPLYSPHEESPDFLLLSGSPRIHMERLLVTLKPGQVIADGSNYRSSVLRWERSCRKLGIPFHNTYEDGVFIKEFPSGRAQTRFRERAH